MQQEKEIQVQFRLRAPTFESSAAWIADKGLLEAHVNLCKVARDATLLDVCCGTGIVGGSFKGRVGRVVGVDVTEAMRTQARQKLDEVHAGSAEDLPFPAASFDAAVCRQALHFLDAPRVLSEIYRVLRPDGQVILSQIVPYGSADAAWMERIFRKKQPLLRNFFLPEDLPNLMKETGFLNITTDQYLLWEEINTWIDSPETSVVARDEIENLYRSASPEAAKIHPFEIAHDGTIRDRWRWVLYSGFKPAEENRR